MGKSSDLGVESDDLSLIDKVDKRLPHPGKELLSIIRIACHCLTESPRYRPTMEHVCKEIVMSKSSSRG
ncbi:unnamed protein product [Lathyrus oleraceus]